MEAFNQSKFIQRYNKEHREPFNENLFIRDDYELVEEIKNVILSCQKLYGNYIIKVMGFELIEDYAQIVEVMHRYEENSLGKKDRNKINQYDYINLKDTDYRLLIVKYYISDGKTNENDGSDAEKHEQYINVYIQIPRTVKKYYFKISGNLYSAIYQIVDGSTYNNVTSLSKSVCITLKLIFMPLKIFRYTVSIRTTKNEEIKITNYCTYVFNKLFNGYKYILAKFGLIGTFKFTGIDCISITQYDPDNDNEYTFCVNDIYISVPKYVYDNDLTVQSLAYAIYLSIVKINTTTYNDLFSNNYWLESLGAEFTNSKVLKGASLLQSLEGIYDIKTKEVIKLPEEQKADVYCIIRWMMREFSNLRSKDNLDISTKRVRYSEYLASLYAMKLSQGIYRLSGKNVTLAQIRKAILIRPSYLIESIVKCNLVNYRNLVNDLDAITALKFSYKGISGMGEKGKSNVPDVYKFIHPSHFGRVDVDSSSKSDPGMTGILCPTVELYSEHNSFSDFEEPNTWNEEFDKTMASYKSLVGLKEVIIAKQYLLGITDSEDEKQLNDINESIDVITRLIDPIHRVTKTSEMETFVLAAEEGGNIYYEHD